MVSEIKFRKQEEKTNIALWNLQGKLGHPVFRETLVADRQRRRIVFYAIQEIGIVVVKGDAIINFGRSGDVNSYFEREDTSIVLILLSLIPNLVST